MKWAIKFASSAAFAVADASSQRSLVANDKPDKVLVLSRHGVRRQFPSSVHDFSKYAPGKTFATEDAEWGVDGSMGVLTQHGYDAAHQMGVYQGRSYKQRGFVIHRCEDVFVYCEEDMPRDFFTAEAFFKGFAEGYGTSCKPPEPHSEEVEYLIDQGSEPRGKDAHCSLGTEQEVAGRMGQNVEEYTRLYRSELQTLNDVLGCCDRSLCGPLPPGKKCTLLDMKHAWDDAHWYDTFTGPIYAGKYFGEWFELTYLNGMEAAWGKLTEEQIMDLSSFVTLYRAWEFDLLAARPFGSALLLHVLASLELWAEAGNSGGSMDDDKGEEIGVEHRASADLVYYAAHDTNLLYVAELLGLKWLNKGWQPNHTPPGGMLVFELYAQPGSRPGPTEWDVALFFDMQTPSQVRTLANLTAANPPDRAAIAVPGCGGGGNAGSDPLRCPLPRFRELVLRAIDLDCVMIPKLRAWGAAATVETLGGGASSSCGEAAGGGDGDGCSNDGGAGADGMAGGLTQAGTAASYFGVACLVLGSAVAGAVAALVGARAHARRRRAAASLAGRLELAPGLSVGGGSSRPQSRGSSGNGGGSGRGVTHRGGHAAVEELGLLADGESSS